VNDFRVGPDSRAPQGFVLAIGAALLLCVAIASLGFMALVQRGDQKDRAMHLADSASLAAAKWQAQILNYHAYANRAIAANEIMMVQSLTLLSWVGHMNQMIKNVGTVSALFPPMRAAAESLKQVAEQTKRATEIGVAAEIPMRSAYAHALSASQKVMHDTGSPFATQALINEIVWTANQGYFGQYLPTSDLSKLYFGTRPHDGADRAPYASHIIQSIDPFSVSRGFDSRLYLLPTGGCIPTSIDRAFGKLVRRGGSGYEEHYTGITAVDTLSAHQWRKRSWWRPTCSSIDESFPISWGAASTAANPDLYRYGGSGANPGAAGRARDEMARVSGYQGLPPLWDVKDTAKRSEYERFRISVMVRGRAATGTSADSERVVVGLQPLLKLPETARLYSVSSSEVYFDKRPLSGVAYLPNLFEPRWNARLVTNNQSDLLAAEASLNASEQRE